MKKILLLLMSVVLIGCGDKYVMVRKALDAVNATTPASSWDGQHLEAVQLIEEDNLVEFYIKDVGGRIPSNDEIDNGELVKGGTWFIANFMTAYDNSVKGEDGEGDCNMFKQVGPLLKLLVGNKMGVRFKFDFRDGGSFLFDMSPNDVAKAVKLRKKTFYEKYE